MAKREYKRLTWARPRSGFTAFTHVRSSLWLGNDHLLCIDTSGYTENYKRFYFKDIQAVIVRRTKRWLYWNIALGIVAAFFVFFAYLARAEVVGEVFLGVIACLFASMVLLNMISGPTCVTQLRTAVQTEELPSVDRLRKARRVLLQLRPAIETAQGQVTPELAGLRTGSPADVQPRSEGGAANAAEAASSEANVPPRIIS